SRHIVIANNSRVRLNVDIHRRNRLPILPRWSMVDGRWSMVDG
ncbi:MAG: hypothetical protein ACI9TP_001969, partial [Candidatus Azotimanducaceae bacterium]